MSSAATADGIVQISIFYGKQQAVLTIPVDGDGQMTVRKLKGLIEPLFGTPVAAQKLLFKGKELLDASTIDLSTLPSKPKMMLLSRAPSAQVHTSSATHCPLTPDVPIAPTTPSPSPPPAQLPRVVVPVGENQVLVQVIRGKDRYRFAMDTISSVFDVKTHLEVLSGVAARSQRLLFKGKYPTDDLALSSLVSSTKPSLIFMLLFDERQHVRVEAQVTTVELQLQLVTHRTNLARLEGQIQRNFFDATDVSLRLRQLLDAVEILLSNAEIACDSSPSHDLRQLSTDAQALRDAITQVHEALITRRT